MKALDESTTPAALSFPDCEFNIEALYRHGYLKGEVSKLSRFTRDDWMIAGGLR
jgi:putative component of membrane protein insertase Oxa1/YidC/SpoIIIJ protein YidD